MKKLLLALALTFAASAASAQTCPTRPLGTNDNSCASTAFVQNALGGLPTFTNGSVLFAQGGTFAQDNANFFWDRTNHRLGLGTNNTTTVPSLLSMGGINNVYAIYINSPTWSNILYNPANTTAALIDIRNFTSSSGTNSGMHTHDRVLNVGDFTYTGLGKAGFFGGTMNCNGANGGDNDCYFSDATINVNSATLGGGAGACPCGTYISGLVTDVAGGSGHDVTMSFLRMVMIQTRPGSTSWFARFLNSGSIAITQGLRFEGGAGGFGELIHLASGPVTRFLNTETTADQVLSINSIDNLTLRGSTGSTLTRNYVQANVGLYSAGPVTIQNNGTATAALGFLNAAGNAVLSLAYADGSNIFQVSSAGTAALVSGPWTYTSGNLKLGGSSTGVTTLASANAGASNFTITFPAVTGTVALTGTTVASFSAGTTGFTPSTATTGAVTLAGTLVVANGGTNCSVASITCFNNITGYTASGATGTTSTNLVFSTSPTIAALTVTGSFTATGLVTNADLVNASTTVNSQTCTLGSTCTISLAAAGITVGTSVITSGTTTRILYDNVGVLGEYTITGSGTIVAMAASPTFTGTVTMPDASTFGTNFAVRGNAILTAPTAASLQFGATDVDTGPVAQTLRSQGTLAGGTSNISGANWTFIASPGKGTGTGGSFVFQTTPAGSTGTVVGTATTVLTLNSAQQAVFAIGTAALPSITFAGFTGLGFSEFSGGAIGVSFAGTQALAMGFDITSQYKVAAAGEFAWSSNSNLASGRDTNISRSAAGTIQIGTTAQNALGSLNLTNMNGSGRLIFGTAVASGPQPTYGQFGLGASVTNLNGSMLGVIAPTTTNVWMEFAENSTNGALWKMTKVGSVGGGATTGIKINSNSANICFDSKSYVDTIASADACFIASTGVLAIQNTTDATTSTTGAITIAGGMSIAKRVWIPAITASAGLQTAVLCQSSGGEMIADSVACLASTERSKIIFGASNLGLATVMALDIIDYQYKDTGNATFDNAPNHRMKRSGFRAEAAAKIDRRLVAMDSDGEVRTIVPDSFIAALWGSVRELKADNDNLRDEVAKLSNWRR